jgi:hypothetical protein
LEVPMTYTLSKPGGSSPRSGDVDNINEVSHGC